MEGGWEGGGERPHSTAQHSAAQHAARIAARSARHLVSDVAAVRLAQAREDLAQRADGAVLGQEAGHRPGAEEELAVEVGLGEAKRGGVELERRRALVEAERVERRRKVAVDLLGVACVCVRGVVRVRVC